MKKIKIDNLSAPIIILGIVIVGLFVALYFFYGQITMKGEHIVQLTEQSEQNVQSQEEIKNLTSSFNTFEPQAKKIDSYIVASDGEVDFINQVETLAKSNNLNVQINSVAIKNSPALSARGMEYLTLRITVDGNWSGNYRFLSELLNMPYQISLTRADMSASSDTQATSPWESIFDIQVLKKSAQTQ